MSDCKIISIANQKGGVGKTTTTFSMGVALAKQGKKVLLIDADPQGDLTTCMGWHNNNDIPNTLKTLMEDYIESKDINYSDYILKHNEGVDVIPSNIELAAMEVRVMNEMGRERIMRNSIEPLRGSYDYILIDCQPSLGILTVNALTSSDEVIIPIQAEFLSTKGLNQLLNTTHKIVSNDLNKNLKVGGILITMVDERTNLAKSVREELVNNHGRVFRVFNTNIPRAIKTAEATSKGESILSYDQNGKVALAYQNLVKEVINGKDKHRCSEVQSR